MRLSKPSTSIKRPGVRSPRNHSSYSKLCSFKDLQRTMVFLGTIIVIFVVAMNYGLVTENRGLTDDADSRFHQIMKHSFESLQTLESQGDYPEVVKNEQDKCIHGTSEELDKWLESHPNYFVLNDTLDKEMCVRKDTTERGEFFLQLHEMQSQACEKSLTIKMINSGWAADLNRVTNAFITSLIFYKPFHPKWRLGWHYSTLFELDEKERKIRLDEYNVCPSLDMSCYFIPFSKCYDELADVNPLIFEDFTEETEKKLNLPILQYAYGRMLNRVRSKDKASWPAGLQQSIDRLDKLAHKGDIPFRQLMTALFHEYVTRPKQHFRVKLAEKKREIEARLVPGKCAVMHVRRGDSKILLGWYRKYHDIKEYLDKGLPALEKNGIKQIFLLTDSSAAIDEAEKEFPDLDWVYFKRSRYKADEGGFEAQLPSKSPELESLYITATLDLVQHCPVMLESNSHLSHLMTTLMCSGNEFWRKLQSGNSLDSLGCPWSTIIGMNDHEEVKKSIREAPVEVQGGDPKVTCIKGTSVKLDDWLASNPDYVVTDETLNEVMCVRKDKTLRGKFYKELHRVQQVQCKDSITLDLKRGSQSESKGQIGTHAWADDIMLALAAVSFGIFAGTPVELKNATLLGYTTGEDKSQSFKDEMLLSATVCHPRRKSNPDLSDTIKGNVKLEDWEKIDEKTSPMLKQKYKSLQKIVGNLAESRKKHNIPVNTFYSSLLYDYVIRPKQEFRIQIKEKMRELESRLTFQRCAVMYVEDDGFNAKQKLHSLLAAGLRHIKKREISQILIIADNDETEREAKIAFPEIDWVTFDRGMFKSDFEGYHRHRNSSAIDHRLNAIYFSASLEVAQTCNTILLQTERQSDTSFSTLLYDTMCGYTGIHHVGIDQSFKFRMNCPVLVSISTDKLERAEHSEPSINKSAVKTSRLSLRSNLKQRRMKSGALCMSGTTEELDDWLSRHPQYYPVSDTFNEDMCVMEDKSIRSEFFLELHKLQYAPNKCDDLVVIKMINSGWAADFNSMDWGFSQVYGMNRPSIFSPKLGWHYAVELVEDERGKKTISRATDVACPTMDLNCYFLPTSICSKPEDVKLTPVEDLTEKRGAHPQYDFFEGWDKSFLDSESTWVSKSMKKVLRKLKQVRKSAGMSPSSLYPALVYDYITRPNQLFRAQISAKIAELNHLKHGRCAVMHVRRGDSKILVGWFRKYHNISEYVDAGKPFFEKHRINQIFLMSDSSLAIKEALTTYPEYDWLYFNRERYKADEGGFESQLPSKSARIEATYIQATTLLVRRCPVIIQSNSHLSKLMYRLMCAGRRFEGDSENFRCPDTVVVGETDHEEVKEAMNKAIP